MLYVGLSGYSYKPWQGEGRFYPPEMKQKEFFKYYSDRYRAVEMDGTWYRMPSEAGVAQWTADAPEGFKYTFKMHRNVSHIARLKLDSLDSVKFFLKRLEPLEKAGGLGAVYFQLPPNFKRNDERLVQFLDAIPPGHPYAVEFRNETWFVPGIEEIMRAHNVAWVSWDTDDVPGQRRDTGSFIYARLRCENYTDEQLASWAAWFRQAAEKGKDCYAFIKHEDEGSPWVDADRLLRVAGER